MATPTKLPSPSRRAFVKFFCPKPSAAELMRQELDALIESETAARVAEIEKQHAAEVTELKIALKAIEPFCQTEAEMLDYASLNDGRASDFGVASMKVRKAARKLLGEAGEEGDNGQA